MERKRRLSGQILRFALTLICLGGCTGTSVIEQRTDVEIRFRASEADTKALLPDEEKISDINILIFDENGFLEQQFHFTDGRKSCRTGLLSGMKYSIYACANIGYRLRVERQEDLNELEYFLTYPDEYREGIPMSASETGVLIQEGSVVDMNLERLMSKISLTMDRSRLSEGVSMDVIGVIIGNCPKKVKIFSESRAESEDDCFNVGFTHMDTDCSLLNTEDLSGKSGSLSLYMLENLQGKFSENGIDEDEDKVLVENDPRASVCSYIEIWFQYHYGDTSSKDSPLIYRFYLGEDRNSMDIERNSHYHITVCPEDDGLNGDGWRVDKSGLGFSGVPSLVQYPDDYIVGDIGERIHIGCSLTPSDAPFDIGLNYLEADKAEGIYDYEIDKDGHGVTLTLTGPGRGLIYMEAGDPINDAALFMIEVNLP